MIVLITILAIVAWLLFSPTKEKFNSLVVEKSTGRIVALVYVDWNGSLDNRMDSMIAVEQDYSPDDFEVIEFNEGTIGQYDLHLYNRD